MSASARTVPRASDRSNSTRRERYAGFQQIAPFLSKRSLVMIKSTLRRSVRRAQVHDLIARNVIEFIDLPSGRPGRPSRAMIDDQAAKVLKASRGQLTAYVKVVRPTPTA